MHKYLLRYKFLLQDFLMTTPNCRLIHLGVVIESRGEEVYISNRNPSPVKYSVQKYYSHGGHTRKDGTESGRLERVHMQGCTQYLGPTNDYGNAKKYYSITTVSIERPPAPPPLIVKANQRCSRAGTWQADGYSYRKKFKNGEIMSAYKTSKKWNFIS